MLTNKDIIEAMEIVGYSMDEIVLLSNVSKEIIEDIKNGKEVDDPEVEKGLNEFLRRNISEVKVERFGEEPFKDTRWIYTPNGFKKVLDYKTVDLQHCYKITFKNFSTIAGDTHQFQLTSGKWITADKVKVGDKLKGLEDEEEVTAVAEVGDYSCCSLTVEDGEYYLDGIVSK